MSRLILCAFLFDATALAADGFVADPDAVGFRLSWESHATERTLTGSDLSEVEIDGAEPDRVTIRWHTSDDVVFASERVPCDAALSQLQQGLPWLMGAPGVEITVTGEPCGTGELASVLADKRGRHADVWEVHDDRVILRWEGDPIFRPLYAGGLTFVRWEEGPTEYEVYAQVATKDGRHYEVHLPCTDHRERADQARILFPEAEHVDVSSCSGTSEPALEAPEPEVRVVTSGGRAGLAEQVVLRLEARSEDVRTCVPDALGAIDVVLRLGRDGRLKKISPRKNTGVTEALCLVKVVETLPPFDDRGSLKVHIETAW